MCALWIGTLGFVLYFVYDINSFTWKSPLLHKCFLLGTLLLSAALALDLYQGISLQKSVGLWQLIWGAAGAGFLCLLIHALFFALPFENTYCMGKQSGKARPCDQGVYAMCRHPGVLFLFGVYFSWGMAVLPGTLLRNGIIFSLWNVLYVLFQDRVTFPTVFEDYDGYRRRVPFLIPTKTSIQAAWATRHVRA